VNIRLSHGGESANQDNRVGDRDFAKLYHPVIDFIWGYLPPTAKAIYPVILRFADYRTRIANVSQGRIGAVANWRNPIAQSQVSRTIHRDLVPWGLVVVRRYQDQYKRWHTNYYLPRKDEIVAHLVSNGSVRDEVVESFRRRYGEPNEECSVGDKDRPTERNEDDMLDAVADALNGFEVDIDVY